MLKEEHVRKESHGFRLGLCIVAKEIHGFTGLDSVYVCILSVSSKYKEIHTTFPVMRTVLAIFKNI